MRQAIILTNVDWIHGRINAVVGGDELTYYIVSKSLTVRFSSYVK